MLNELCSKLSDFCGLKQPCETSSSNAAFHKYFQQQTKGAVPFSQYISYRYYDPAHHLFTNEDGVLGFMIEIAPIVGCDKTLEKNLHQFFNSEIPPDSHLQFLLIASSNIEHKLAFWKNGRQKSKLEIIDFLTKEREEFIRKKSQDFGSPDGRIGRDFHIYVSYSSQKEAAYSPRQREDILRFQSKLMSKFESIRLHPRLCDSQQLIFIVRDMVQMNVPYYPSENHDFLNPLNEQVLAPCQPFQIEPDKIVHSETGLVSKIFYPTRLPKGFSLLKMINLLGSHTTGGSIPARFLISYSIATNINKAQKSSIIAQGNRDIKATEQIHNRYDASLKAVAEEWIGTIKEFNEGIIPLTDSFQVMITTYKEHLEIAQESLTSLYNIYGWNLVAIKNFQAVALLSSLPMQQSRLWNDLMFCKLAKRIKSSEVLGKLPIHCEYKGSNRSGVLLLGRCGQIFCHNPYNRVGGGGNYNEIVLGPSGGGKSVYLQEQVIGFLGEDISTFVFDIGNSYKNICNLIGVDAEHIQFSNANFSLNPFALLADTGKNIEDLTQDTTINEEKIEALKIGKYLVAKDGLIYAKGIVASMCGVQGNPHKEAIIEKAIYAAIKKYGTALDITKLAEVLAEFGSEIGRALSETLFPFSEYGSHGRYFKAGKTVTFKKKLTLFEFEEIKNDKVLLTVILQIILMQITIQFLCGDRGRLFRIIVDEAWMILDFAASFLEVFARTVRKYGGGLTTCVQDIGIFSTGNAQRAVFDSSTWKILLPQSSSKGFDTEDEFKDCLGLISSLHKDPNNKYSEILISTNGLKVIGRPVLDPVARAAYSTESEDYNYICRMNKEGKSAREAVLELSKKYEEREVA